MRIEELRSTLTEQADGVGPQDPVGRLASVQARVTRARRRRRTTVVTGALAALVVAGAGIVPMLDRDATPDPVDGKRPERLAGMAVPAERTAAGFTYRYVEGVESEPGAPVLSHVVPRSDGPQLVMWASSHRDDESTLRLRQVRADETERAVSAGFGRYTLLDERAHPLRLSQPGAPADTVLALAVYELVDEPLAGISDGDTTFRQQVLERELVDARIGAPGETDVSVSVTAPERHIWVSQVCSTTLGPEVSADMTINGRPYVGFGCDEQVERDPGAGGDRLDVAWVRPGRPLEVRLRLVDRETDEVVEDPGAVLGVAVYDDRSRRVRLSGWDVPVSVEYEGQEWVHDGYTYESRPGSRSMGVDGPPRDVPVLVAVALSGRDDAPVTLETYLGGELAQDMQVGVGTGVFGLKFVVQPGTPLDLRVRVDKAVPGLQLGVLYYELVER